MEPKRIPVSVVVMTKNEESNIAECLERLARFDEVVVVDSGSTDRTTSIAESMGARIVTFAWNGHYPKKKQWCMDNIEFRNDWLLYADADELATQDLVEEIAGIMEVGTTKAGFFVGFDYVFLGRTMNHGHRVYKLVFHRKDSVWYEPKDDLEMERPREVEGTYNPAVRGVTGRLNSRFIHNDQKSLFHYFDRHNRYSDWHAKMRFEGKFITPSDTQLRGRGLAKAMFNRLPMKAPIAFIYSYVFKLGFLDGRSGFHYAVSNAVFYWQISCKILERERLEEHSHSKQQPTDSHRGGR